MREEKPIKKKEKAVRNPSEGNVNKSESNCYYVKYHKATKTKRRRKRKYDGT